MLTQLFLNYNDLTGACQLFPHESVTVRRMPDCASDDVVDAGAIPTELGQLTALRGLTLIHNWLTGARATMCMSVFSKQ